MSNLSNERNDQLYNELVSRAAKLERQLGIRDSNFSYRPRPWLKIRPVGVSVEHGWAIRTIYRASIIAWLFMLISPIYDWLGANVLPVDACDLFDSLLSPPLSTLCVLIIAFSVALLSLHWFRVEAEARDSILSALQDAGIDASPRRTHNVSFNITTKELADNSNTIFDALKAAEKVERDIYITGPQLKLD